MADITRILVPGVADPYNIKDSRIEFSLSSLTGSIVTFNAQYSLSLKSHTVDIDSVSGVSAINIGATGLNLWGGGYMLQSFINMNLNYLVYDDDTLTYSAISMSGYKTIISDSFKPNTQYTLILVGKKDSTNISANISVLYTDNTRVNLDFVSPANVKQTLIYTSTANKTIKSITGANGANNTTLYYNECGIFEGVHTIDEFEPFGTYKNISIGQTVNEATYNARTGVMEVTQPSVQTIQLPPCPIDTLEGVNNIWADTGDTTLQYISNISPLMYDVVDYVDDSLLDVAYDSNQEMIEFTQLQ